MTITYSRKNTPLQILHNGEVVGYISPSRNYAGDKTGRFVTGINGHFWNGVDFEPIRKGRGGRTVNHFTRLSEAKACVEMLFEIGGGEC